eukprot:TRINITY_DN5396_c0_g1_i1.p1 TRINITY_DN5396_c0_g1~~TRINITY_DN5396_c0_g1_i1.p1  ORF type:complete len:230 (-),score=56.52 TRINITY_DN5396_c0_g1_i1:156-845(-)
MKDALLIEQHILKMGSSVFFLLLIVVAVQSQTGFNASVEVEVFKTSSMTPISFFSAQFASDPLNGRFALLGEDISIWSFGSSTGGSGGSDSTGSSGINFRKSKNLISGGFGGSRDYEPFGFYTKRGKTCTLESLYPFFSQDPFWFTNGVKSTRKCEKGANLYELEVIGGNGTGGKKTLHRACLDINNSPLWLETVVFPISMKISFNTWYPAEFVNKDPYFQLPQVCKKK